MKTAETLSKKISLLISLWFLIILILPCIAPLSAQEIRDHRKKQATQKNDVEVFNPKSTNRVKKEVLAHLPFHTESKLVSMEFVDGMAVIEGDIVLGPSILYSGEIQQAVVIDGDSYRWNDGIIPYTIESGHPKSGLIQQAIQHIHEQTNLRLVPRSGQNDYVSFVTGDGCSSRVGKCGGKQKINIGSCGFGSIVHEILHTAGVWHEQSREDRNDHITILWDNIKEDKKHNFERHVSDGIDIGEYDCSSIMHYSAYAFSKNSQPTITSTHYETFGQRSGMSIRDIAAINELYPGTVPENLTNRLWYLEAKNSGKVLDIRGGGLMPKINVQQFQLNHTDAQKFRFLNADNGYYYIHNIGSDLVLDVEGRSATATANVQQNTRNSSDSQKWRLIDAGNGYYYLRSKLGDLNLEIQGGGIRNGINVRVADINGGSEQQFKFKKGVHAEPTVGQYTKALEHYWNSSRKDNFTTASSKGKNNAVNGNYRFVRVDGYVLTKPTSVEGKTTPLYLYYNNTRKDNFITATAEGIRAAEAGGYRNAGIEGYVLKSVHPQYKHLYKPLWLYYHSTRKDNFVTATRRGMDVAEAGGYRKVRIEGYVRINNFSNLAPSQNNQLAKEKP